MELEKIMQLKNFVVVGDTLNPEKYAYKIKEELIKNGYQVNCVGKELNSINDVDFDIDVIDLCINPIKGLQLLRELNKSFKCIVIQPGASNEELIDYLNNHHLNYIDGCLLLGLKMYR